MMDSRNLKLWFCLACLAASMAAPAPTPELYLDIIDMAAISRMSPQQLEKLAEGLAAEEIMRTKRSSAQAISSVVSKASSGLQNKIGLLGQASAFISSASSKSGGEHQGYNYEPPQHDQKYDYWGLKKSILYTLFQAVKAITGGVTILKGQLIKGGGALATTLGKVIAVKGDAVSNLGKKIVSSAALSEKKPHSTPVYGPPPATHIEYGPPPSAYGAPTAPAHYHTGPSLPTGYAAHKYPATLDAPIPSAPSAPGHIEEPYTNQPPPPPQPAPEFKPMAWGAVNSYGEPAAVDAYSDYDPRNPHLSFDYASSKHAAIPTYNTGLTPEKIQKINFNLQKVNNYLNQQARSSEDLPKFNGLEAYREMLNRGPRLPTPVITDNEIGVLPAELLPDLEDSTTTTSTTTSTTTTESPKSTTVSETRRKDVKYFLRGNRIVLV